MPRPAIFSAEYILVRYIYMNASLLQASLPLDLFSLAGSVGVI